MRRLRRPIPFIFAATLLLACGESASDVTGFTDEPGPSAGALRADGLMAAAASSPVDGYAIKLRDSVNWFVGLDLVEDDGNLVRYKGQLYYVYSGREIIGEAKAVWNKSAQVLTIQTEDTWDEDSPDLMAYAFHYDGMSGGHQTLRGGWAYLKAKWQGGTAARVLQGSFPLS